MSSDCLYFNTENFLPVFVVCIHFGCFVRLLLRTSPCCFAFATAALVKAHHRRSMCNTVSVQYRSRVALFLCVPYFLLATPFLCVTDVLVLRYSFSVFYTSSFLSSTRLPCFLYLFFLTWHCYPVATLVEIWGG